MISMLVFAVVIGLILYLINTVIPMPDWFRTVINVIACLIVIIWLLQWIGFAGGPQLRLRW
jgi:uncharacterized protein YhhL (DUF1145 family)